MPLRAYRHDAGWLLGRTFLEFVHTGRKTGQLYETVAMVLRYDPDAREAVIISADGAILAAAGSAGAACSRSQPGRPAPRCSPAEPAILPGPRGTMLTA